MKELNHAIQVAVEEWVILPYPIPAAEAIDVTEDGKIVGLF